MIKIKNSIRVLGMVAVVVVAALATETKADPTKGAYACQDTTYGVNTTYYTTYGGYNSTCTGGNTSAAAGSVVTTVATLNTAVTQTAGLITSRVSALKTEQASANGPFNVAMNNNGSAGVVGLSSGDMMNGGWGVWAQGTWSRIMDSNVSTRFDGSVFNGLIGVDYKLNTKLIVGVAAGYENQSLDTAFNNGTVEADGYMLSPYLSATIDDMFSVDLSGGVAMLDYDLSRSDPNVGTKITGETDAMRYWGLLQANLDHSKDNWLMHADLGVMYAREKQDSFVESDTTAVASQSVNMGQFRLGGQLGYDFGKVTPYGKARLEYDFAKTDINVAAGQTDPKQSDLGLAVGAGVLFDLAPNVSASVEGEAMLLRDNWEQYTGTAKLRIEF